MSDNLPCSFIVSAFVLFLLIARPPEGVCLHMGVPSSSPPVLPPSLPVAPAATTPLWSRALWSRSPTPSTLSKVSDVFHSHLTFSIVSSIPPRKLPLLPEFLLDFLAPLGPGFTLPPDCLSSSCSSVHQLSGGVSQIDLEATLFSLSKLHHCSQSLRCCLCADDSLEVGVWLRDWVSASSVFSRLDGAVGMPCTTLEVSSSRWNCFFL